MPESPSAQRPKVLAGLFSDMHVRNLVDTGALENLASRYDVGTYSWDGVKSDMDGRAGLRHEGSFPLDARASAIRERMRWVSVFAGARVSETMRVRREYEEFGTKSRALYTALSTRPLWPLSDMVAEAWVGESAAMRAVFERVRPDAVVFLSQGNEPQGLDTMRAARSLRVPSIMLINAWDNVTSKGIMRVKPDRLCVWGADSKEFAMRVHGLPAERIEVVGACHFQQYFDYLRGPRMEPPAGPPRLLFAGNSRGHAEAQYLRTLEDAIESGDLPPLKIVYRPHPWRSARHGEPEFHEHGFRHIEMDPQLVEHYAKGMNAPEHRPDRTFAPPVSHHVSMLASVRGVITPFSTLALEAMIMGLPVLGLDMFDQEWLRHAVADFEHLQRVRHDVPGVSIVDDEARFIDGVRGLLASADDPTLADRIRKAVGPIVYDDGRTFGERLSDVVERTLAGLPAAEPIEAQGVHAA